MKKYKIKILIISLVILTSCEKLVEIDPPQDQLVSTTVFESDETASSAATGLYASMMKSDIRMSYNISLYTGMYGDEQEYVQTTQGLVSLYKYFLDAKDAPTNSIWRNGFNYIYQANSIIEGIEQSPNISAPVRKQLTGEALFLRAFWSYYMTLFYGEIPIIISTDYNKNAGLSRSPVNLVNGQIIKDLNAAKGLLTERYVSGNSISETSDRIRVNTFVASALLSRIYLQEKEYAKAEEEATSIISNSKFDLSNIDLVFKRTSKEVIWQIELPTETNSSNSYEATMYTLTATPTGNLTQRCTTIDSSLYSLFADNDKRKSTWIGTYTDNTVVPAVNYNFPSKYKTRTMPADEYTTPFRLAETYLIRAEARAYLGNIDDAINDTDKIRARAGLSLLRDITPNISKEALLDSIYQERQRELFCEWAIRWSDIRRSPSADNLMRALAARKSTPWRSTAILWPIPLNDVINSGEKLKQNEGYN